ncbi:MAG: 2TM domain-containing protein [Flavobacteriales bacterium]|nr:MAG: 2TM domain-containing protein [Flavobacteriales bacterium]
MANQFKEMESFIRARKKVERIKDYYAHVVLFVLGSGLILLLKDSAMLWIESKGIKDPEALNWFEWNMIFIPIIWGFIVLVAAFVVFKGRSNYFKRWEERQIRKFMEEAQ